MADVAVLDIKVQTKEVKDAKRELDGLSTSGGKTDSTMISMSRSAVMLAGKIASIAAAATGVVSSVKAIAEAGMQFERLGMSMAAITGSRQAAGQTLEYVRAQADKAGVSFLGAADAFKSLLAAGSASGMAEKDVRGLFSSVVEAGAVVGMTQAQQERSLLALEQMISKGVVSTEELRRQLGDSLPGAFSTAAKAMGVTTMELDKMLEKGEVISKDFLPRFAEQLRKDFGGSIEEAGNTGTAAVNRMTSAWDQLKASFYSSGLVISTIDAVTEAMNRLRGASDGFDPLAVGGMSISEMRESRAAMEERLRGLESLGSAHPKVEALRKSIAAIDREMVNAQVALGKGAVDLSRPKTEKQLIEERAQGYMVQARMDKEGKSASDKLRRGMEEAHQARMDAIDDINKLNADTVRHTASIYSEIAALDKVSGLYGDAYSDKLTMLNAAIKAQEKYTESVNKGVSAEIAAAEKTATLAKAQRDIDERKNQAAKGVAGGFAGPAYDEQVAQIQAQYDLAKQYTTDREALERAMNQKLTRLESARLRATGDAWDGMKAAAMDYAASATNAGENMARVFNNAFSSMEDALVKFATTGKLNFTDMTRSILADIVRMQIRAGLGSAVGAISGGGLWSSISGLFGFNHGGGMVGSPTFSRQVPLAAFAGAERFHDGGFPGLKSDEVPIIAQRGERVLSRQEVAAGAGGSSGTQTVTVIMKDSKGNQTAAPMSFNTNGMREFILNVVRDGSERGLLGSA